MVKQLNVKELISILESMPKDLPVYFNGSEWLHGVGNVELIKEIEGTYVMIESVDNMGGCTTIGFDALSRSKKTIL